MTYLPVVSCDGCGVCCDKQGTPPMMPDEYAALPEALKWDIDEHAMRYDDGLPCLWFNAETRKCNHYEHRGSTCREFEMDGVGCLGMRADRGITTGGRP